VFRHITGYLTLSGGGGSFTAIDGVFAAGAGCKAAIDCERWLDPP